MQYFPLIAASLLPALFIITKLFGGRSLNSIRANTVGHGQHGSIRRSRPLPASFQPPKRGSTS